MTDPYLTGVWAPTFDELDVGDLAVSGEIPAALDGAYLRNGPNPQLPPLGRYHLFDGDGMVHAVELHEGRARYRNRWVESAGLLAERRAGRALFGGLSEFTLPAPEVVAEAGIMKNTANTHVVRHAGRILALMEAARPVELTAELATVGEVDFDGALVGPMTAHPKVDPVTGEMVFFGYSPFPPFLHLHVADADGRLTQSHPIPLPGPVMMHDFAVTATKVVFFDLPAVFDLQAMLAGEPGIRWEPSHGARIGVLERAAPEAGVRWAEVEPFFMFHVVNAHDDESGGVVVHGCRAARLNAAFGPDALAEPVPARLHRWHVEPATGQVRDEALDERPGDFPRIDDRRAGLPARYGYLAHPDRWGSDEVVFDRVVKHDLVTGTSTTHHFGATAAAGEPCFAPDPTREGEDAGWVLDIVTDRSDGNSDLVILDAETLEESGRVHLPQRVPNGFHGSWMPTLG